MVTFFIGIAKRVYYPESSLEIKIQFRIKASLACSQVVYLEI